MKLRHALLLLSLGACGGGEFRFDYYQDFDEDEIVEGCTYLDELVHWRCQNFTCHDYLNEEVCLESEEQDVERCRERGSYCVVAGLAASCEGWMAEHPYVEDCESFPGSCAEARVQADCP